MLVQFLLVLELPPAALVRAVHHGLWQVVNEPIHQLSKASYLLSLVLIGDVDDLVQLFAEPSHHAI